MQKNHLLSRYMNPSNTSKVTIITYHRKSFIERIFFQTSFDRIVNLFSPNLVQHLKLSIDLIIIPITIDWFTVPHIP